MHLPAELLNKQVPFLPANISDLNGFTSSVLRKLLRTSKPQLIKRSLLLIAQEA
jgi:hypothetical protein